MDWDHLSFFHCYPREGKPVITYQTIHLGLLVIYQLQFVDKAYCFCRISSENYGVVGFRHGSEHLSLGATFVPFSSMWPSLRLNDSTPFFTL